MTAQLARELGPRAHAFSFDISDPEAVREGHEAIERSLGGVDILLNNAGILSNNKAEATGAQEWRRVLGAKGRNFYHNLATRYGFGEVADRIQELYLSGRKREAIDAVPDELVRGVSLIGPRGFIAERLAVFAESGVTTLLVRPVTGDAREAVRYVEELLRLLPA